MSERRESEREKLVKVEEVEVEISWIVQGQ